MKSLQVITLGCSKNTVDTEHLLAQLASSYEIVMEGEERAVDYLLLNTCGFIWDAKEESVQAILEAAQRKKNGKVGKLMVFGCLSQRYPADLPGIIPEVDAWFGARDLDPIVRALGVTPDKECDTERVPTSPGKGYAYLKISEGCDRRCSFCAIPFIRGAHRSVPMEQLEKEAAFLASQGVKELILIAQDTTYYGLDLYRKRCLGELLRRLSETDGIEWIRIHYSYPADFPEDVLVQMAENPKVCKYLDIPLQHISDNILTKMNRHVTGAWTRELIHKLRERVPGVVLRTTMIVGYPRESKKDFNELLDFVREARFERLGAFAYSQEEGTKSAEFLDVHSDKTKNARLKELMSVQSDISAEFNNSRVGTEERVMVDDFVDGVLVCRSSFESPDVDGEILVRYNAELFSGVDPYSLVGEFIRVRITSADVYDLTAELVEL